MLTLEPRTITALEDKGQEAIFLFRQELADRKINASGFLSSSARFELQPKALVWYAADYVNAMDEGSPPGTRVSATVLIQWAIDKGIKTEKIIDFAERLSDRIYRDGTITWQDGGLFLLDSIFDQEYIDEITAIIKDDIQQQILTQIKRGFKIPV